MNRQQLGACLIAIAATGCSSDPPRLTHLEAQVAGTEPLHERQDQDLAYPAETGATLANQTPDELTQGFLALARTRTESVRHKAQREYEQLSALPEAGSRALQFHLGSQTFNYSEDGDIVVSGPIASGTASSPTPTGNFSVLSKDKDKESSLYTNEVGTQAWMPYSMQFHGNYFVHEGWLPGYPASHGCIRLGHHHAKLLFERMKIGDPVTVSN
ncbi:MAG: L,D-transpeptidase [Chromatiaceae bacterium]|jgi:lipoprotein-anchoring transpeptidase ErfK/SrfK|nr:L,D-transpeptidase [Chromatiaceae bacterium]